MEPLEHVPAAPRRRGVRPTVGIAARLLTGAAVGAGAMLGLHRAGIATGIVGALSTALAPFGDARLLVLALIVVVIVYACVLVHEGGHTLAAVLNGFEFRALYIGPLCISHDRGRLHVGLRRTPVVVGGLAISVPRQWTGDERFHRAFTWFVAGGPLASFFLGALSLGAAAAMAMDAGARAQPPSFTWVMLAMTGAVSLFLVVVSLAPMKQPGGFSTDGAQLWEVRRRGPERIVPPVIVVKALGLAAQVARPRDWDDALVARLADVAGDPDSAPAAFGLAYYRALDTADLAGARKALQQLLALAAASDAQGASRWRASLATEAAVFEAVWRRDAGAAERWLGAIPGGRTSDRQGLHIVRAGLAALHGDGATARAEIETARRAGERGLPSLMHLRAATLERFAAFREMAEQPQNRDVSLEPSDRRPSDV